MRPPPALRNADFRSLWLAALISDAGDWLLFIALPIVVYRETGSALGTSLAFLIELAPGIGFAALVGRLADRWDRRRMLLVVSLLQALALLPLLFVHDRSQLPVVYAVIFGQATLAALFDPAKNALLPTLLPADELVSANALVALSQNFGRLLGGPLGGLLLVLGDLRLIAAVDLISYLLAATLIARLRPRLHAGSGSPRRHRSPVPAAFLAALRGRRVRASLLVAFIGQTAQGIFVVLFVLFVAQRLHGGSAEIGLLRGLQAIGAIAAGLILSVRARGASPAKLTAWSAIAFGIVELVLWNLPLLSTAAVIYVTLFIVVGAPGVLLVTGIVTRPPASGPGAPAGDRIQRAEPGEQCRSGDGDPGRRTAHRKSGADDHARCASRAVPRRRRAGRGLDERPLWRPRPSSGYARLGEHDPIVLPGIDIAGDAAAHRNIDHLGPVAIEQLPHPLVAVQRRQLFEGGASERERVPPPILVAAGSERSIAAAGDQGSYRGRAHTGLIAQHQHEQFGARVDRVQGGGDR